MNPDNRTNYRPVWAEIDLKNLDYNFNLVRKIAGPKVKILVPVKAHGYGHGLVAISKRLESLGVDYLGVASIDEGIVLRNAGVKKPVVVLGTILPDDAKPVLEYSLIQTVCTKEVAESLNKEAQKTGAVSSVHIKVDTGMNRIGVAYAEAYDFIRGIALMTNIKIEGIFTHFPCAEENPDFTQKQIDIFGNLINRLEAAGIEIPLRHAANSMGVIDYPKALFNLVRPGLMIYGLYPKQQASIKLRPLLSLKTKIIHLHTVGKGEGVSYGHTYVAEGKMKLATLSIGYGDGYPRCLSNKAFCLISGKRVRLVGNICMDQMMADVTDIKDVKTGADAVMIGAQGREAITVEELAGLAGTIPYEIVCGLGTRTKWVYKG